MKKKDETRYFVTDIASVPVYTAASKTEMFRMSTKPGSGTSGTANSGANGPSAKIFLLPDREVGYIKTNVNSQICDDGAKLDYFLDGGNTTGSDASNKRIADCNGSAVHGGDHCGICCGLRNWEDEQAKHENSTDRGGTRFRGGAGFRADARAHLHLQHGRRHPLPAAL